MQKTQTYLDYNATAPVLPDCIELMREVMALPANASSVHSFGRRGRSYLEKARDQLGALAGAEPAYITFNSGATEGNNTVLQNFSGRNILVSAIEHPAVTETATSAATIPVTEEGLIDLGALEALLSGKTNKPALIAAMLVNNETGVIQPIEEIVRLVRKLSPESLILCDAAQAPGKIELDFSALQVDYLTLSAHKMGGPAGVGALITSPGAPPVRLLYGGGQEKSLRAGTENVAAIAAFGLAAERAKENIGKFQTLQALQQRLENRLKNDVPAVKIFGNRAKRIANTTCICYPAIPAQTQMMALDLDGIAVSSGSACSSGTIKPSKTLLAMGATEREASSSLRISTGWDSTSDDIDRFLDAWLTLVSRTEQ